MSNTLLPCPFCGGEATISDGGHSGEKFLARCRDLSCPAASGFIRKTHDEAVAAWNSRSDAVPVVRGEWIQKHHIISLDNMTLTGTYPTCSLCGYAWIGVAKNTNYCPNCGAKMEDKP